MGKTKIEWSERVWNPVTGCTKVSQGCKNCYAETFANRKMGEWGKIGDFMKFLPGSKETYITRRQREFTDVICHPDRLEQPLHWRKPAKVFVNSMSDLFHESVPFEFIDKVFYVMMKSDKHTFQILTKRPERALLYLGQKQKQKELGHKGLIEEFPLKNVWLGVSVEDQKTADERIPLLLQIPAAVRFLSCEPLLGEIDLDRVNMSKPEIKWYAECNVLNGEGSIDWVICGGESGHGARPMHPDWARKLRDDCISAGVPFFFKQWGEWGIVKSSLIAKANRGRMIRMNYDGTFKPCHEAIYDSNGVISMARRGKKYTGRLLDGVEWNGYPVNE